MADYTAPFQMPKFNDDEFYEKKAEYVKEHGYSITLPRFGDIVHMGLHRPMSNNEKILWYSGKRHEISKARQIELYSQKERSRATYKKYMSSPIPRVVESITSVLTAIDNTQDAIISLAAIGRIACFFLPRIITSVIAWPIGLLWLIATILGLLMGPSACALNPMACKRYMRMKAMYRSQSMKGRVRTIGKRAKSVVKYEKARLAAGVRGFATSGKAIPSFSEGIQMAQVTDSIWGVGISIGPIFGAAYDLISGGIRWVCGQEVHFKNPPSDVEIYRKATDKYHNYARWKRPAGKMSKAEVIAWKETKIASGTWGVRSKQDDAVLQAMRLHQHNFSVERRTNWTEETLLYTNAEMAGQGLQNVLNYWDPILNIEGAEHIEIEAYNEPNPLVEEMLREEGVDPESRIAWPSLGKRWATYEELQTSIAPVAADNIKYFTENCPNEVFKEIAEKSATSCGLQAIASLVGAEWIEIKNHAAISIAETLLDKRYAFPTSVTEKQVFDFGIWMQECEETDRQPGLQEILAYAKNSLGFEFVTKA